MERNIWNYLELRVTNLALSGRLRAAKKVSTWKGPPHFFSGRRPK
jgi:hypothetical protein